MPAKGFLSLEQKQHLQQFLKQSDHFEMRERVLILLLMNDGRTQEEIVAAHLQKNISIRKVANIFSVTKSLVQKLVKQQKVEGNLQPKPRGKPQFSHLTNADIELRELIEAYPDATLIE